MNFRTKFNRTNRFAKQGCATGAHCRVCAICPRYSSFSSSSGKGEKILSILLILCGKRDDRKYSNNFPPLDLRIRDIFRLNRQGAKGAKKGCCRVILILEERARIKIPKPYGRLGCQVVDHSFNAVFHEGDVPVEEGGSGVRSCIVSNGIFRLNREGAKSAKGDFGGLF